MISVIIPAYNHERFIGAAVESVLGQSWTDLELLVIDDGSTDKTAEIVQGYDDPRLIYVFQENQDAFNTINRGLGLTHGEYVAILNSDDVYTLDRLEKLVTLQQQTGAQCLFTDVIPISDSSEEFVDPAFGWNAWHQKNRNFFFQCGDLYTAFLKGNFMVTTSNLFMTAQAVQKVGEFCSLRYLHDYDFIFRMMLAFPGQVHYVHNEKLLYYRIHSGNTLGEAAITGREQDRDVIRKYMMARVPDELQGVVSAGTDRLLELEHELIEVRNSLQKPVLPAIKKQIAMLIRSFFARITSRCGS
jgi:glycosyltransferase involved in cell wall biosynthesis